MGNEPQIYGKGLVSVVTPVFNGEKYVSRLLQSVLDQTYPRVEMILVDDGSEDRTVLAAERYREQFARKGYRYEIIRAPHKNASAALNRGLPLVRGEYLVWPDGDDRLAPESIEARVRFLLENPAYSCVRSLPSYFDDKTGLPAKAQERRGTNVSAPWLTISTVRPAPPAPMTKSRETCPRSCCSGMCWRGKPLCAAAVTC